MVTERGVNIPPVYPVDSTHATQWNEDVYKPAAAILEAYLQVHLKYNY